MTATRSRPEQDGAARRWRAVIPALALLAAAVSLGAGPDSEIDPVRALAEGNTLVAEGRLEDAVQAYRAGWDDAAPHPTVAYNLGTVLHRLDRLPEAVLWYRRSPDTDDPWLEENLWLARRSLGSQQIGAGTLGDLASHAALPATVGVGLAWLFLILVTFGFGTKSSRIGLLVLTAVLYLGSFAIHAWSPRAAVLLEDCSTQAGDLPAGTEVWVRAAGEGWRIAGTDGAACSAESIALVRP